MQGDGTTSKGPTRRDYVKYGGAIVGGGLLAGCASDSTDDATPEPAASNASTATDDAGYSVTMSPVGEVTFESVPERVAAYGPDVADVLVALGQEERLNSLGLTDFYGETLAVYYDRLDGVSFDASGLTALYDGGLDKEVFYELDSDLHLIDPCGVVTFEGWSHADVDEIRENVAPWLGNEYSREHSDPPEGCAEDYEYYTLYEIAERIAAVFKQRERFEAIAAVHERFRETIRRNLPPESERPTVGLITFYDESFHPYEINGPGYGRSHVRPMGAVDVFADDERAYGNESAGSYGYEAMLELDPDVILHNFAVFPSFDWGAIRETVSGHPVGRELKAVREGRFYASGAGIQGPIMNLFQLEMTAKQLYPERFGEWPGYVEGQPYPEIPEGERLFDRGRVADIVDGDI
ncbi:ABC transporter substrate-binding protein [Halomarina pelagica]|uniref:ABC transporter substrate-binding protein n=1 Tax=Halomarina pelagica TaxID=2961599 RepID=UPI0020C31CC7|nr:ABC transporter substrate-binding protein [Halomarina sp. BND7]